MSTSPAESRREVQRLENDVATIYELVTGVDGRITTIASAQLRQGHRLDQIEDRLFGVESRLGDVEIRLDRVDGRLAGFQDRLDGIDNRLDGVDNRLDGVETHLDGIDGKLATILDLLRDPRPAQD